MKTKQSGFGVIAIILIVLVLGIGGFIAWRLVSGDSQSNQTNSQTSTPQPSTPQTGANSGYVLIKEWGVRFAPPDGITDIIYFRPADTPEDVQRFDLSTQTLVATEPDCGATGFGAIERTQTPLAMYELSLGEIAGYHYYFRGAQAACSQNPTNFSFESDQRRAVQTSITSLEAAK